MKTKTIEGKEFTFRDKKEITWGAENRARDFVKKHLLEIDIHTLGMLKGVDRENFNIEKDKKADIGIGLDQVFTNPEDLAKYLQAVDEQKEKNEIAAMMLVTNLEYSDLEELPVTTMRKLEEEVKMIINDATDFLTGLGISTQSKLMADSKITNPELETKT